MTALWLTIAGSSLAGSLHCVAMCGPLVGLHGGGRSLGLAAVHALGRLTTYATLGALAGVVGGAVEIAGHLAAVQHVAALVAGGAIVAWGVRSIAVALGGWRVRATRGALFQRGLARIERSPTGRGEGASRRIGAARDGRRTIPRDCPESGQSLVQLRGRRAAQRAYLIGLLTGLLPCGWLWAFVVSAAGTASPAQGAAVMAVFWLGTVPVMTGVLALGGTLVQSIRLRMPVISAGVLIALGLATLAIRWQDAGAPGVTAPHCHEVVAP